MERLFVVLFLAVVSAVSGGLHLAVVSAQPARVATHALGAARTAAPPSEPPVVLGAAPSGESAAAMAQTAAAGAAQSAASTGTSSITAEDTIYTKRGVWQRNYSTGREARIQKGPMPRPSALVPILMYHNVRPIDFKTTNAFVSSLTLPPTEFDKQLRYLKERGFSTVSMMDVVQHLRGELSLPPKPIVLTFDDGFENNHQYAFPLLRSYGYSGTFYIITGLVGKTEYMTWRQVGELARGGMEIGSHTINHPDLARASQSTLDRELTQSRKTLEDVLGVTVTSLSYPSGAHNEQAVAAARQAGYASAVTTKHGAVQLGAKPLEMTRVRIQGPEGLPAFRWKIEQFFPAGDHPKQ